jgi:hypothetical protein
MIVVATNNGDPYLETCLGRIAEHTKNEVPVVVVDTFSSDIGFRERARVLAEKHGFTFIQAERPCYDFGAYMLGYKTDPNREFYHFQHDSLYLKSPDLINDIRENLIDHDIAAWLRFDRAICAFDHEEQRSWLADRIGTDQYEMGIYGPNFSISDQAMKRLSGDLSRIEVDNKWKQQGMERGWPIMAQKHGLRVTQLESAGFVWDGLFDGRYKLYDKATHPTGHPRS